MSSYLGNIPSNNFVSLKRQVITGNGGASYTLDYSVSSVNDVAIFVNNVRQNPSSYSISTTSLTLGGTISSSDSCYVIFLGQGLQTVTPANNTITNAMIQDGTIAESKLASGVNTITVLDKFVLTSAKTGSGDLTANLARESSNNYGGIGSTMTESSGIFTFPSTGIYLIKFDAVIAMSSANSRFNELQINTSIDSGSNYNKASNSNGSIPTGYGSNAGVLGASCSAIFDVTNTSTHQVKFSTNFEGASAFLNSSFNETSMTFIRLGDT